MKLVKIILFYIACETCYAREFIVDKNLSLLDWSLVKPGDIVRICGRRDNGYRDNILDIKASGKKGKPITITWDCPENPSLHISAGHKITEGWLGPDKYGVYSVKIGGHTSFHAVDHNLTRLTNRKKLPDKSWNQGEFAHIENVLYYKPYNTLGVIYTAQDYAVRIKNQKFINLVSPKIYGIANDAVIILQNADYINIIDPELKWGRNHCIKIFEDSDYVSILGDINLSECGNGIYSISDNDQNNNDFLTIKGNGSSNIYNLDQDGYYGVVDNHGIGIQGGNGVIIENLEMYNLAGSCITHYVFPDQSLMDNLVFKVKCNNVYNYKKNEKRFEIGLEYGNHNIGHNPNKVRNNIAIKNSFYNIGRRCLVTKSQSPTSGFGWAYIDNFFSNCTVALEMMDQPDGNTGFVLIGNTFSNYEKAIHHRANGESTNIVDFGNNWMGVDVK